jgi:hypothetical protein
MPINQFTGTWTFDPRMSRLTWPSPHRWVQFVSAEEERLRVREEIVRGSATSIVEVDAAVDGTFYPVSGSPMAEEIAYSFQGGALTGIGRQAGQDAFREVITVTENTMTAEFSLILKDRHVPIGTAHFNKEQ